MKIINYPIVLILLITFITAGTLNASRTYTEHFTTSTYRIDTASTTALVDTGSGQVQLPLDISEIGTIAMGGVSAIQDIKVKGGFAYVANKNEGLRIVDVTNPSSMNVDSTYNPGTDVYGVDVRGNYAYIAADSFFKIVDISNSTSPVEVGSLTTGDGIGNARKVFVWGNRAYLADGTDSGSRVNTIDISTPTAPVVVDTGAGSNNATNVYVKDKYVYVTDEFNGLFVYDIDDLSSVIGTEDTSNYAFGLHVSSNYAYIATTEGGLRIMDITYPTDPKEVGSYYRKDDALGIYVSGNYVYLTYWDDPNWGLDVINITDKTNPVLEALYQTGGECRTAYAAGPYVYIGDGSNLKVIKVNDISTLVKAGSKSAAGSDSRGLHVQGDYAYSADNGRDRLEIFDISVPENPVSVATYDEPYINDVFVSGRYAFLAAGNSGLSGIRILDISNPASITPKGSVSGLDDPKGIWVDSEGKYAYVADYDYFTIIDVSDVNSPAVVASTTVPLGYAQRVTVHGDYAYVSGGSGASMVNIYDISIATKPVYKTNMGPALASNDVYVSGDYAYVAGKSAQSSLSIYDISNPTSPISIGTYSGDELDEYDCVFLSGQYAYVGDDSEVRVIDINNPSSPTGKGNYSQNCNDIWVGGNYIYCVSTGISVFSGKFEYDTSSNTVISTLIRESTGCITSVTLTPTHTLASGTSIYYYISVASETAWTDFGLTGGTTGFSVSSPNDLRWKAIINGTSIATPYISTVTLTWTEIFKPAAPTNISDDTYVSSFTLTWIDNSSGEHQEDYFNILNAAKSVIDTVYATNIWTSTGLTPNTTYQNYVRAYNVAGSSDSAIGSPICTLVDVFDKLTVSTNATDSLKINFSTNTYEPSDSQFAIYCVTISSYITLSGGLSDSATFYTYSTWVSSLPVIHSNLFADTTYIYKLIGKNIHGIKSTSTAVIKFTLISTPASPDNFSGVALSTGSIKWTWDDNSSGSYQEDYFYIKDEFNITIGSVTADTTYWTETYGPPESWDLTPNTTHYRYVQAYNLEGGTSSSSGVTVCTLVNVSSGSISISSETTTSLEINLDSKNNPADTKFAIYNSTPYGKYIDKFGDLYSVPLFCTYSNWDLPVTHVNLSTNTQYTYQLIGKNHNGVKSTGTAVSKYTSMPVPEKVIMKEVSPINITVEASDIYNINKGSSAVQFKIENKLETKSSSSTWTNNNWIAEELDGEDLDSNTKFRFTARTRNADGITTAWSTVTFIYTSPVTPTLESDSHPNEGQWYSDTSVDISAIAGNGGFNHLHYVFDQTEFRDNDDAALYANETSSNSFPVTATNDGIWYLHVVAHAFHDANLEIENSTSPSNVAKYTVYIDTTAPGDISSFNAAASGSEATVDVTWTNPTDPDYQGTIIIRSTNPVTFAPVDETSYSVSQEVSSREYVIHITSAISKTDSSLNEKTTYYYKSWAYDKVPKYSVTGSSDSAKTGDFTAPADLSTTASDQADSTGTAVVSWTATDATDFEGYHIYRSTSDFASSGYNILVQTISVQATVQWINSSLTNDTVYYYAVAAYDTAGNEDTTVTTASATPVDDVKPAAPVVSSMTVTMNDPGTDDMLAGSNGTVESSATVKVYKDIGLTVLIGSTTANSGGAFSAFSIGDNQADASDLIYIIAVDASGNESVSVSITNNVTPPADLSTTASDKVDSTGTAVVSWTQYDNPDSDFAEYRVYRATYNFTTSVDTMLVFSTPTITYTVWDDTSVADGTLYYYAAAARDDENNEDRTVLAVSVTPADDVAPEIPDVSGITVSMNAPGTNDTVSGSAGTVESSSTVKVYKDSSLTALIGQTTAAADGSFAAFSIGDNQTDDNDLIYIVALDASSNISFSTSTTNDTTAPQPPVSAKITLVRRSGGTDDMLSGSAGAVENNAVVKVYSNSKLSSSQGQKNSLSDGSFAAFSIGDDQVDSDSLIYVVAVDAAGNVSFYISIKNDPDEAMIEASEEITVIASDAKTKVKLAANALGSSGYVKINLNAATAPEEISIIVINAANEKAEKDVKGNKDWIISGSIVEFNAYDINGVRQKGTFGAVVTITLPYEDANDDGIVDDTKPPIDVNSLKIYVLNATNKTWEEVTGVTVDTVNKNVYVTITHFSVYSLMGQPAYSDNLDNAHPYPTPFKPSDGHTSITFTSLTEEAIIEIYTIDGILINTLEKDDTGNSITWTDPIGDGVSSGVYIYVITPATGNKQIGKFIVIK